MTGYIALDRESNTSQNEAISSLRTYHDKKVDDLRRVANHSSSALVLFELLYSQASINSLHPIAACAYNVYSFGT